MKREKKQNMKDIPIKKILCRLLAAAAALALLLTVIPGFGEGAETAGAPEQAAPSAAPAESFLSPEAIRSLLRRVPDEEKGIVDDLVPLNLSCEDNGIRLEIIAGAVKEQQALFIYSLEDLEGNQINEDTAFPLVDFCLMTPSRGSYSCLDSDQAGPKHTYTAFIQFDTPAALPEKITASLSSLLVEHTSDLFIQGMLEKYGSRSDLVDVPEVLERYLKNDDPENPEYYTTEDYRNAGVKVLDYKNPLSVRLHKNLELSGIAVADGQLHVQVHYLENAHRSWPTSLHSISRVWVDFGFYGNYISRGSWQDSVSWNTNGDLFPEYKEFIFPWNPKEGDRPVIRVQVTEVTKEILGDWNIDIPLADVRKGSVPPAKAPASEAEAAPAADPAPWTWQDELESRLRGEPAELQVLAKKLVPVHSVCEIEGIRFELISAAINETAGLAVYSIEDLEGSRINELSYPIVNVVTPMIDEGKVMFPLHDDEADGKALFATHFKTDGKKALDSGSAFRLEAPSLDVCRRSGQSILGLLQKYGSRAKLVEVPEIQQRYVKSDGPEGTEFYTTEDLRKAGVKVLDYQNPLSVRLHKNLELSGIGVVNGNLHVQVHYIDNEYFDEDGSWHTLIENVDVSRTVNGRYDRISGWRNDVVWSVDNGNWPDFQEFITSWDELAGYRLGIMLYITELVDVINGNWTAEVPVQDIWVGEGVPAGE